MTLPPIDPNREAELQRLVSLFLEKVTPYISGAVGKAAADVKKKLATFAEVRWNSTGDKLSTEQTGPIGLVKHCFLFLISCVPQVSSRRGVRLEDAAEVGVSAAETWKRITLKDLRKGLNKSFRTFQQNIGKQDWRSDQAERLGEKAKAIDRRVAEGTTNLDKMVQLLGVTLLGLTGQFREAWDRSEQQREQLLEGLSGGVQAVVGQGEPLNERIPYAVQTAIEIAQCKVAGAVDSALGDSSLKTGGQAALVAGGVSLAAALLLLLRQQTQVPAASGAPDPLAQAAYRGWLDGNNAARDAGARTVYRNSYEAARQAPPVSR